MGADPATWRELAGYLASALVLAAFSARSMAALRTIAIASNLAFITYGYAASLNPVLLLHLVLLPTNVYRLTQALRAGQEAACSAPGGATAAALAGGARLRPVARGSRS